MSTRRSTIAVIGASGLIGEAIARGLTEHGFRVAAIARGFTAAQEAAFGSGALEFAVVDTNEGGLAEAIEKTGAEIVVNCVGVLQDRWRASTDNVHLGFVRRLVAAIAALNRPAVLIQISIPGDTSEDTTRYSRTKREAEQAIATSPIPFVILRPGLVVASTAFGGSALMRALALMPLGLPAREANERLSVVDVNDIVRTVEVVAAKWSQGERSWSAVWDVMTRESITIADVLAAFRRRAGVRNPILKAPTWLLTLGARSGDLISFLGWEPPLRSTALRELRRGVYGNPQPWIAATGIEPSSLETILLRLPHSVQEKWFARLYLLKPVIVAVLAAFWIVSGLIALTAGFARAVAFLQLHDLSANTARFAVVAGSSADVLIGLAIAFQRSCRSGLLAGIALSCMYLVAAIFVAPEIWGDPLGPLVKVVPTIVLMLVALVVFDNR